jgi:hypothetical protein
MYRSGREEGQVHQVNSRNRTPTNDGRNIVYVSVLVRRLAEGRTYEDFVRAWYPATGFGVRTRGPFVARNVGDDREIVVVAFLDLGPDETLEQVVARISGPEAARHERIEDVIESTQLRGIYEVAGEFDFSTDATVLTGRPAFLDG